MSPYSTAHRIAKNTVFLYLRSIVLMLIAIYSSRIVLSVLGVESYGLYGLVGGVVALFSSLKGVFSSAIQRYLNYTRGLGDEDGVRHVFSISVIVQLGIAILFFVIVELFGLWFIPNKLEIPNGMMDTALFVFHCSIITSVISIMAIPLDALIIANERMNYYAYISIFEAILKLAVVFLLPLFPFVPLRCYAVLLLLVYVIIVCINLFYCRRFPECRLVKYWDSSLFKQLASFSGWNFLGNVVYSLIHEGTNIILNLFGGVVANASRGIAIQVRSALETLSVNINTASKPFIMQQAASVNNKRLFNYIYMLSRAVFYVMLVTTIPIIVYSEQLLSVWLVEVPDYSVSFVRVIMLFVLIRSLHSPIVTLFFASGNIKHFQIAECIVGITTFPLIYIFLSQGLPLYSAFVGMIIIEIINLTTILLIAQKELGFKISDYYHNVLQKCVLAFLVVSALAFVFFFLTHNVNKYVSLLCLCLLSLCSVGLIYITTLSTVEKGVICDFIHNRLHRQ